MLLEIYKNLLKDQEILKYLQKYLELPCLLRLKEISYLCGMDYASKNIYKFNEKISRFDHSLTVALLTYKLTKDRVQTLAGLFHDIATPCFSHVIDYMNKDYEKQESTEEYTEEILKKDNKLKEYLKADNIEIMDIINFKKYSIVDNERPKVCADRIDGVILTGISWTKNITKDDISNIIKFMKVYTNEDNEKEIGFNNEQIAKKILEISESINILCHSKEDNFMMQLLADITSYAIKKEYISYQELYYSTEKEIFSKLNDIKEPYLKKKLETFYTITVDEIPNKQMPKIKKRELNPLINGKRLK